MFDVPMYLIEDSMFGCSNDGICLACGEIQPGCEPDARGYECEVCGEKKVFGLEEAMMMGAIHLT